MVSEVPLLSEMKIVCGEAEAAMGDEIMLPEDFLEEDLVVIDFFLEESF